MRILVAGGAGFLGSAFVHRVLETRPHAILTVLDAFTYAADPRNLPHSPRLRVVHGDIRDPDLVDALTRESEVSVNFAAESHNDRSISDPGVFESTNVRGTLVLLEAARRHRIRFHQVSTDEVYGDLPLDGDERFEPGSPFRPSSPYSASKAAADHLVRAWARTYGLQATVTHSVNGYGPRQHPEKFIPRQITNLLTGRPAELYGTGLNIRGWVHADDHADAVLRVLERGTPGGVYLIGTGREYSNRAVLGLLLDLLGADAGRVRLVADRPGHDRRYAVDATATRALGWRPAHPDLVAGLRDTVHWYRAHPERWTGIKDAVEAVTAERPTA
ncbi:MAG: dTDP-glucose 4,6-dehydratase [Microbacteriaceae bacterium]|jgi:dTDP-glucose 4,6-dehydratase|nr:dTDP-glucose 4,6-dehydratase [Microbacteriaceae bacterium]